jgi:diacylglycerol kinase family enzyme
MSAAGTVGPVDNRAVTDGSHDVPADPADPPERSSATGPVAAAPGHRTAHRARHRWRKPGLKHRVQAIVALASLVVLIAVVLAALWDTPGWMLLGLIGLALTGWGGWWAATEQMPRRAIGFGALAGGVLAVLVAIPGVIIGADRRVWSILLIVGLTALAFSQARLALVKDLHRRERPAAPKPQHPVLFANRNSGGGKVDSFDLILAARTLGVETVVLQPGDDLEQLALDAVERGADCLGMAGGDGSQALVAGVAAGHDVAFVCIPAGTRNHLALDLGLDRDNPRRALSAFADAVERRIDIATVGEMFFVNNVSLGAYAEVVQSADYRDAKLETSLQLLPELLGKRDKPFDLQFTGPDGDHTDGAFLVLVSNNPYVLGPKLDATQRRSLTTGRLGVLALTAANGPQAASVVLRAAVGFGASDPNLHQFESSAFEVRSGSATVPAGVDGEAMELAAPLQFRIHHRALRVRVPPDTEERLIRRRARNVSIKDLVRVAAGRPLG